MVSVNKIFVEQKSPEPKVKASLACMSLCKSQIQEIKNVTEPKN